MSNNGPVATKRGSLTSQRQPRNSNSKRHTTPKHSDTGAVSLTRHKASEATDTRRNKNSANPKPRDNHRYVNALRSKATPSSNKDGAREKQRTATTSQNNENRSSPTPESNDTQPKIQSRSADSRKSSRSAERQSTEAKHSNTAGRADRQNTVANNSNRADRQNTATNNSNTAGRANRQNTVANNSNRADRQNTATNNSNTAGKADRQITATNTKESTLETGSKRTIHSTMQSSRQTHEDRRGRGGNPSSLVRLEPKYTLSREKHHTEENPGTPLSERRNGEPHATTETTTFVEDDDDSLQMFLSSDSMEREEDYQRGVRERERGRKIVFHRQCSEAAKRKHEEVIRRILEEFDLEETKDKYRNSNACEIRRNGRSLADFRFRSELIRMMGTDVIRLSDHGWSARFQDCLRHDYERQLNEQMHNLAEAEVQRLHRLRLEGIIQDSTGKASDDLMRRAFTGAAFRRGSRGPSQRPSKVSDGDKFGRMYSAATRTFPPEPCAMFSDEDLNRRERALASRRTNNAYRPPRLSVTIKAASEKEEEVEEAEDTQQQQPPAFSEMCDSEIELPVTTREERREKRFKRLPPQVAKLYDEETVEGLYHWAKQLVGRPKKEDP